jgi:hypothetical protein
MRTTTTTATHLITGTAVAVPRTRQLLLAALLALAAPLAAPLALVAPAVAQPAGPTEVLPQPDPHPDPEVALQGFDRCDPAPGVTYEAAVLGGFDDRPFTARVDWSNQDTGASGSTDGLSGAATTGEGTVELVAIVTYPAVITLEGDQLAAAVVSSSTVTVLVDCPSGVPGDGGGDDGQPGDDVVTATPTFTG